MPRSKFRPVLLIVTLVVGAIAGLIVWPQGFGAHRALFFSQLIAFRGVLTIGLGAGALLFAAIALLRKSWGFAAVVAIVLTAATAASGGILATRGAANVSESGDVTVVAWNTQGGAATSVSVSSLVLEVDADVVSLPETGADFADDVARLVGEQGHAMRSHTTYGLEGHSEMPTSLLISERLGEYREDTSAGSTPGLPSAVWLPVDGSGPTIVGAHTYPPLPGGMGSWRAGLEWVAQQCDGPDVIVAGDLNATVDHLAGLGTGGGLVGSCDDAALSAGAAAIGTWPTSIPALLAAPIDHVLVGSGWRVRAVHVSTAFDEEGSDHRPIVAVLTAQ